MLFKKKISTNCGTKLSSLGSFIAPPQQTNTPVYKPPVVEITNTSASFWKDLFVSAGINPAKAIEYDGIFMNNGIDNESLLNDSDMGLLEQNGNHNFRRSIKITKVAKKRKTPKPNPAKNWRPRTSSKNTIRKVSITITKSFSSITTIKSYQFTTSTTKFLIILVLHKFLIILVLHKFLIIPVLHKYLIILVSHK